MAGEVVIRAQKRYNVTCKYTQLLINLLIMIICVHFIVYFVWITALFLQVTSITFV